MPGSKRRALKKILSPDPSPSSTPIPNINSQSSLDAAASPPKRSGSSSSHFSNLFHHSKSPSQSQSAIASDSHNYMSDEALEQNLVVEEMMDRQQSIGSGNHRVQDGVPDLNAQARAAPPPPPPKGAMPPPATAPIPQQMTAEALMFGGEANGNGGGGKKKSSKQRFAERQARRQDALIHSAPPSDPAWNAQLERERQEEIQVISDACNTLGREIHEIAPDGHCMFNAIADQLSQIGLLPAKEAQNPHHTRQTAAKYMLAHPDDFMPFLPSITGEDSTGATDDGMMTEAGFKKYCSLVAETGEWGGEPEIQALSRAFGVPIHVFQRGPPTVVSHGGAEDTFGGASTAEQSLQQGDGVVRISYHKRMYGLGEHYNSLRKAVV